MPPNKSFQRTWGFAPREGLGRQLELDSTGTRSLSPPHAAELRRWAAHRVNRTAHCNQHDQTWRMAFRN